MANWELYEKKIKIDGDKVRDRYINNTKNAIVDSFANSPSYFEVYFNNSNDVTGVQIVSGSSTGGQSNSNSRTIIMQPNDLLNTGDLIKWNNEYWLCMESELFSDVYYRGKIIKTTHTLSHYKNGILLETPMVIDSNIRLYSMGIDENKYISTNDDEVIAYIPNNDDTSDIQINQVYAIGRRRYEIISVQDIIIPGLLVLKMEATVKDVVVEDKVYTLDILNGEEQTIKQNDTLLLNVRVSLNGIAVSPTPQLLFETSSGTVCVVSESGLITVNSDSGNAIVTVKLESDETISDTIKIIASPSSQTNYTYAITGNLNPDTEILYNQEKIYTVNKYDTDGNIVDGNFLFSVVGDIPSNKYILTTINDNQCSLKSLGYAYQIALRAMDIDTLQYIDKQIILKSIF